MARTRKTGQKEAMAAEIARMGGLFSARELLLRVRKSRPDIGQATVYRQLKSLSSSRDLHRFRHGRTVVYSAHSRSDAHFICTRCGATRHIELERADFIGQVKRQTGREVCHFQLDVFGVCEKCAKDGPGAR